MSEERKDVRIEVQEGAPLVNHAWLHAKNMVAIYIDMRSKRCDVLTTGSDCGIPMVMLWAGDDALHLDETKPRNMPTVISFPDYRGWDVFSAECSRYTLSVCLIKEYA